MNNKQLAEKLGIPIIDENRKYWLVRTEQGSLWEEFKADSYVAINWNDFSNLSELAVIDNIEKEQELKSRIAEIYEVDKPGSILNTIRKFVFEMQVGDVIMIPSPKSKIISFGIITSDCYIYNFTDEDLEDDSCEFIKRRNVNWIKDINRHSLDPLLFKMLQAHQAVCHATDYADVIDRTLESIYLKRDKVHLRVDINTQKPVGKNLVSLQSLIYDKRIISNADDVHIKLNVQSPGFVEVLYNHLPEAIGFLLILNVLIGGGKAFGFDIPGILDIIDKYQIIKGRPNKEKKEQEIKEIELLKEMYGKDLNSLEIGVIDNEQLDRLLKVGITLSQNENDDE